MVEPFSLPAAGGFLLRNAPGIEGLLKRLWFTIRGKGPVVITGISGAGKTVLLDHLTGTAADGYTFPFISVDAEKGKLKRHRPIWRGPRRASLYVVPGQSSRERRDALSKAFRKPKKEHRAPQGFIHVAPFGYSLPRRPAAIDLNIDISGTIERHREAQLEAELADLEETLDAVREAHNEHKRPSWMIVAVSKIDLYWDSNIDAARRYRPEATSSAFVNKLNKFQDQLGKDYFSWEVLPVSVVPTAFQFGDEPVVEPQLGKADAEALTNQLAQRIAARVGVL